MLKRDIRRDINMPSKQASLSTGETGGDSLAGTF
jgi:hypothetical protein